MSYMPLPLAVRAACDIADDNDRAAAAQELAEGDFDKWLRGDDERGTVADYINDHASERIRIIVAGLLGNEAALERAPGQIAFRARICHFETIVYSIHIYAH